MCYLQEILDRGPVDRPPFMPPFPVARMAVRRIARAAQTEGRDILRKLASAPRTVGSLIFRFCMGGAFATFRVPRWF